MLSFIRMLDLDYAVLFSCPICKDLPHDQLCLIMDGKCMGMQKVYALPYNPPVDTEGAAIKPQRWV